MSETNCEDVRATLPELADEPGMSLAVRRHLSRCPECEAELEVYRSLRKAAGQLALATATPPPGLKESLFAIPADGTRLEDLRAHLSRNRRQYAAGAGVAVAALGAALWRSRRRGLATA